MSSFSFTAEVWEHEGPAAWHFVSLPDDIADEIEETFGHLAAGFGSIRVEVMVGASRWWTSIFPDRKRGTYILPVKRQIRVAEQLLAGSSAAIELAVIDK